MIIGAKLVELISGRLLSITNCVPREFSRKPRSLSELSRWKATEFRKFLLYTGPIILKGILYDNLYNHFLILHLAIRISSSQEHEKYYNRYARDLLLNFVETNRMLYGDSFVFYNVHSLIHLAGDCVEFGTVDSFSYFEFDNHLQ